MSLSAYDSVSAWINQLKASNQEAAAQRLYERYFERLLKLARRKWAGAPRRAADEEDVVLSALDSFCRGAKLGRFPRLADRNDLWQLLLVITERKVIDLGQRERCPKRGGGKVHGEDALAQTASASGPAGLDRLAGREPAPDEVVQMAEELERLLERLGDAKLRLIAERRLAGYLEDEIAAELACDVRTVQRKLRLIRRIWGAGEQP